MMRERLYRLLGRLHERFAFFVPNHVLVLNWEVRPLNERKLDAFDRWLERSCPHGVTISYDKSIYAANWLTNEATNFWGIHQGQGPGRVEKDFWTDVPPTRFYTRDPNTAFELKMKFG